MVEEDPIYKTLRAISKARKEGKFSDLLLVCRDVKIPVHKIIVCPQSPVIDKACNGPFKVRQVRLSSSLLFSQENQEQETGVYEFKDSSIDIVRQMVEYMYTGKYSPTSHSSSDELCDNTSPITFHVRMFELSKKYMIDGLQTFATCEFMEAVQQEESLCKFLRSIPEIYSLLRTPSNHLREFRVWHVRSLMAAADFDAAAKQVLDEVTENVPQFAKELLNSFIESPLMGYCHLCGEQDPVPVSPSHCRCKKCGSRGARLLR
ncbi:BTB/POZ domain protein [Metarhizium acridum CQMa 102]|uniref:BTB/POZ domain protein n=1 Tax=Metarhizium acridum (strain CQMa 102) TaxID=655827 RepID=E9ED34_METAQ|nr:BTB/POZ domain protein [Metarhizium acridum CQMa 102]EFY86190.1 BTB/POZ domain protein [Metarhizium acridum CQMa 102]